MSHTNKDSTNVNPESKYYSRLLASFIQKEITRSEFCKLWLRAELDATDFKITVER